MLDRRVCIPKHNVLVMFSMSLRFSVLNFTICCSFTDDESSKNCIVSPLFSILLKMSFPKLFATYLLISVYLLLISMMDRSVENARYPLCHYGIGGISHSPVFFVNFALTIVRCNSWLLA